MKTKNQSNKAAVKKQWRDQCIISISSKKQATRAELCDTLGVSITSVNSLVNELIEEGLIVDIGEGTSSGGRKPGLLEINKFGAFFVGLEFSADGIACVVLNLRREIIYKNYRIFSGSESAEDLIRELIDELQSAISIAEKYGKIYGIGIGAPGYLDYENGIMIFYFPHPQWNNTCLLRELSTVIHYPIFIRNNVDVMPFANKWVCCNGNCEDHIMMVIRYGFKISAFSNNRQIKGAHDFAGEIGHIHVNGSNRICSCGKLGCYDTEVTYSSIKHKIEEGIAVGRFKNFQKMIEHSGEFSIDIFTKACNEGDSDCIALIRNTISEVCVALSWMYFMIDPETIYISTKLDEYTHFYDEIESCLVKYHENDFTYGKFNVKAAPFGTHLGAVGAAAYIYELFFGDIYKK